MIGFTTVTFADKDIKEVYEIALSNKIDYIEWGGNNHLAIDDRKAIKEIISGQNQYKICASSYGSYYRVGENDLRKFLKICETAKAIDAKIIRVWLGLKGSRWTNKAQLDKMVEELKILCDIARSYDLIVASEFHQKTYNDSAKSALKIIAKCDKTNYKTYWQKLGNEKKDFANLQALLDVVVVCHIFNWKNFNNRFTIQEGEKKWAKYFKLLKNAKKQPYLILEFVKDNKVENFEKDINTIRKLLNK